MQGSCSIVDSPQCNILNKTRGWRKNDFGKPSGEKKSETMMNGVTRLYLVLLIAILFMISTTACKHSTSGNGSTSDDIYDVDENGIPQFVEVDYITLDDIHRISKFRSGIGHDYSDDFETCRSMKHYFEPKSSIDWAVVQIFSPIDGRVSTIFEEWAGTQVQIRSNMYPAFIFIIFHVNLLDQLEVGDVISEGQQLGFHIGSQTMSDIAIGVHTPNGWMLVSYFDVMSDALFQDYQQRGLTSRSDAIISRELRDADTLECNGEEFENSGTLENWVILN
jgi:hypothetical protein